MERDINRILNEMGNHELNQKKFLGFVIESLIELDCINKVILSNQAIIISKLLNNKIGHLEIESENIELINDLKSKKLADIISYLTK